MRKILLLSDTHSYMDDHILKHAANADELWHAGDIGNLDVTDALQEKTPLKAVYGNIDDTTIRNEFPLNNRFFCEDVEVWITHIGGYPGRYSPAIRGGDQGKPTSAFHLRPFPYFKGNAR